MTDYERIKALQELLSKDEKYDFELSGKRIRLIYTCLLYTSDAADE